MCERKAVIKNADMGDEMQQDAVDCATQALEKYNIEKVLIIYGFRRYFSHRPVRFIYKISFAGHCGVYQKRV